jgi:hypothetical protein
MRALFALMLTATAACAAEWHTYANDRFGVTIDVPPGFKQMGEEPSNSDGLTFASSDGKAILTVWGNNILADNFKAQLQDDFKSDQADGWAVSYGAADRGAKMTWAVYSGTKGDMIMYERAMASCHGTQMLHFRIEYPMAQKQAYDTVVTHLGKSLRAGPSFDCS